ncbi:MAG TPA: sugar phosphate isomerase/epimerase [Epulopiscium sp.]|nr:sugar phosphate isomerase/epimerase [Candidatus Epulonipiscium sp.]
MGFPVGIQLYSLKDETKKDFVGALEKVAKMGYQGVEFAGYGDIEAIQMKEHLKRLGLKAVSAHVPLDRLENNLEEEIDYAKVLGMTHIVCPWATFEGIEDVEKLASTLNKVGKTCKAEGITFSYHNHDHEFVKIEGEYILDLLFSKTNPEYVKAELDLCWVSRGGVDEVAYVEKYSGRCPLLHAKDYVTSPEFRQVEVGTGLVNFAGIEKVAKNAHVEWIIVEQEEYSIDPFESIQISLENLRKLKIAQ